MTGPLYNLFVVYGFREAYYQLTDAEREAFWGRIESVMGTVGSKNLLTCSSRWCNEGIVAWGLEEFPDLKAVQESARLHEENLHYRYLDAVTFLGKKEDDAEIPTIDFPNPIYQLWMVKNSSNASFEAIPEQARQDLFAHVEESVKRNGGVFLLTCDCNWSTEEYHYFGVTAWPSLEAEQAHFKDTEKIGWHRYVSGRTILGTVLT